MYENKMKKIKVIMLGFIFLTLIFSIAIPAVQSIKTEYLFT